LSRTSRRSATEARRLAWETVDSYCFSQSSAFGIAAVGNWDAVAYGGAEPPYLRQPDSKKKYPKDLKGEVHDDGEIWSACLWELRAAMARDATAKLVIAHHFLLERDSGFEDGVHALITVKKSQQGRE